MSSLEMFLNEGVFKYGEAALAVESFETAMGEHLAAILQDKENWGPFKKKQRKDAIDYEKGKQASWGRWVQAYVEGKLNGSEEACLQIGLWWNAPGESPVIFYAHFDNPEAWHNFTYTPEAAGIFCKKISTSTYLTLEPGPQVNLKVDFNRLLDELLLVPSKGKALGTE